MTIRRGAWMTVAALGAATVAATALPGEWLELHRDLELWRIVTCHFTHFSYEQLAWDALAFISLAAVCARRNGRAFHATLLASIVLVPLAVLAFAPNVTAYRGLSGLASAMFALLLTLETGVILSAAKDPTRAPAEGPSPSVRLRMTLLLAIGFAGKIAFETFTGGTVFVSGMGTDVVSVPVAHLAGALVGVIGGLEIKRLALLAPLLLAACVSIPLPIPALDDEACSLAKDLLGNWRSQRITQLGPASVSLDLRDDCRFVMRIGLPFSNVVEQGRYAVEGDRIRFKRQNNRETVWPIRRDQKGRLLVQEAPNEWHAYTHNPCASFWPCSSR